MATTFNELKTQLGQYLGKKQFRSMSATVYLYENGEVFISYTTVCAIKVNGVLTLTTAHDYSPTTCRQLSAYTGLNTHQRRVAIANGEIECLLLTKDVSILF